MSSLLSSSDEEEPLNPFELNLNQDNPDAPNPFILSVSFWPFIQGLEHSFKNIFLRIGFLVFLLCVMFAYLSFPSEDRGENLTSITQSDFVSAPTLSPVRIPVISAPKKPSNLLEYLEFNHYSFLNVGDSIAKGKASSKGRHTIHPYTITLSYLFSNSSRVGDYGEDGDNAGKVLDRIDDIMKANLFKDGSYSAGVVSILAGTADLLGKSIDTLALKKSIISTHLEVHSIAAAAPVALRTPVFTVAFMLPARLKQTPESESARVNLNSAVQNFAKSCPHRVLLVDFSKLYDPTQSKNKKFWSDDGIKFSELGYDGIGNRLYTALKEYDLDSDFEEKYFEKDCSCSDC